MIMYIYKFIFVVVFAILGYNASPFPGLTEIQGSFVGAVFATALVLLAQKVKNTELRFLWSAFIGILGGALVGLTLFIMLKLTEIMIPTTSYIFFTFLFLFGFPVTGLFFGILKPNMFSPLNIKEFFRGSSAFTDSFLLDTSAIIDGRIVPITLSGFIEGELIITQFVLAELQNIADSSDPNKKVRGKRGLDIIEQMRSNAQISLTILNKDVSSVSSVDHKIVLLAKEHNFKIVTNDVNLSKIAKLQDIKVLNVNELAYAIKPIVYPGERMKVNIAKEGKEKNQGIAYLNDGTMIVIDDARSEIGKTMQIEVTSVLQTTSGKMIFGKKI